MSLSLRLDPWNYDCEQCDSVKSEYPCPVYNCSSHSSNEKINWTHSNCGGSFRLYENGKEKCQKCGNEDLFCKWKCSCYTDTKSKQYSYAKIKNVLAKLSGMDTRYASTYFLVHVSMCIDRQYKDFPEEFEE